MQLHHRVVDVENSYQGFEHDRNAGDEVPITVENDNRRGIDTSTHNEVQNDDSERSTYVEREDTINRQLLQNEVINETNEDVKREDTTKKPFLQDEVINETNENFEHEDTTTRPPVQDEVINETVADSMNSDTVYDNVETYPRLCADKLSEFMVDIYNNYAKSFAKLHAVLRDSVKLDSTTLTSTSSSLFAIVDELGKIRGSTRTAFLSLQQALPKAFVSIAKIVDGLNVQTLSTQLPGTIDDLEESLLRIILTVNDADKLRSDIERQLNAATTFVAKSVEDIVSALRIMAEATTKAIGSVSIEVQETVIALSLVLETVLVIVQTVYTSSVCVLSSLHITLETINSLLVHLDTMIKNIIGVVTPSGMANMSTGIERISVKLVQLANDIDVALDEIMAAAIQMDISKGLEDLLNRLTDVVGNIGISIGTSVSVITSSLNIFSATSSYHMIRKVAEQINLIYKNISKFSGTDTILVMTLVKSLSSIFNVIKSCEGVLVSGLGTDASDTLTKYTGSVQLSLQSLLVLISGAAKDNVQIQDIVKDIGSAIQYVAAALTSIIITIAPVLSDMNLAVIEAVLSLPIIFSAVLYITQWVLSVTVSIYSSMIGIVSDDLSHLTILVSNTFEKVTGVISTLSRTIPFESLKDSFNSIMPQISDINELITSSYVPISGKILNIVFNIDQMLSDAAKHTEKPIASLLRGTKGTVPEILNNLKGKMKSIATELSSTLFSLNNSLKICSSSESSALKAISGILVTVIKQVTSISGSASEILSLITDSLAVSFGHLSSVVSKFSILGDVSVSLKVSVTNIHSALTSLNDAIDDCSTDLNIIVDPLRNVAKTTQILISTFSAIFDAASQATKDIAKKLSHSITNLTYVVSTIILVVQYVLGAAIAKVLVTFGSTPAVLQELAVALSAILQKVASITANVTLAQNGSDVDYTEIISKTVSPVSELNGFSTKVLSVISLIVANIKVSLDVSKEV